MDHLAYCDLLAAEIDHYAGLVDTAGPQVTIATCPGWSLADLTAHLGMVHRWAEHLVRVRAQSRISSEEMGLGPPQATGPWIRSGGHALVATLRGCGPGVPMWAWGADHHACFWSRRQLHETLVHRVDAELALGASPAAPPSLAADAIDELLVNLAHAVRFSPRVANLRGSSETLVFRATDGERAWWAQLQPEGFEVGDGGAAIGEGPVEAQATVAGPALSLLLVLYRRLPLAGSGLGVTGDKALAEFWLANSALE